MAAAGPQIERRTKSGQAPDRCRPEVPSLCGGSAAREAPGHQSMGTVASDAEAPVLMSLPSATADATVTKNTAQRGHEVAASWQPSLHACQAMSYTPRWQGGCWVPDLHTGSARADAGVGGGGSRQRLHDSRDRADVSWPKREERHARHDDMKEVVRN